MVPTKTTFVRKTFLYSCILLYRRSLVVSSLGKMDTARQKELGTRWAESYDCWVNAPGTSGPIYTCPQTADDQKGTNEWPQKTRNLRYPIFGMTASNPRGEEWPNERNKEANKVLEKELCDFASQDEFFCWWHGLGFGETWQEKGFIVSCESSVAVKLATKYDQAAIYEFKFTSQDHVVMRKTIPVLVPNVEADVPIITCPRPPFEISDPKFEPKH